MRGQHGWGWRYLDKYTQTGEPTLVLTHHEQLVALILKSQNPHEATHGTGKHLVHLRFPTRFNFTIRHRYIIFCGRKGLSSIRPATVAKIDRSGLRSERPSTLQSAQRFLRWLMSYGRSLLNDYLPRISMTNARLTSEDETRELHRSTRILDLVEAYGEVWRSTDYDPTQVQSNPVGLRYALL